MSEVNTGGNEKAGKGKPRKIETRVDFTPMVDMNMLLITFFMLCTSMAKPQTMEIVMPTDDKNIADEEKNKVKDTNAITVILGENNQIYYFLGKPKYDDNKSLILANYNGVEDKNSLRSLLLKRNRVSVLQVQKLRQLKYKKQISVEDYDKGVSDAKNAKDGQVVVIKPMDESTYMNLIDVLDEMQICSVGRYAIVDLEKADKSLVESCRKAGTLPKSTAKK